MPYISGINAKSETVNNNNNNERKKQNHYEVVVNRHRADEMTIP